MIIDDGDMGEIKEIGRVDSSVKILLCIIDGAAKW
jgi:hypothetical protein